MTGRLQKKKRKKRRDLLQQSTKNRCVKNVICQSNNQNSVEFYRKMQLKTKGDTVTTCVTSLIRLCNEDCFMRNCLEQDQETQRLD